MIAKLFYAGIALALAGCSTVATVSWVPELSGATIIEQSSQKQFGNGPLAMNYDYAGQIPDSDGCYKVIGVTAKWPSGAVGNTDKTVRICEGATTYQVVIPYSGTNEQRQIDSGYAQAHNEQVRQQQIQSQQIADQNNANLWATALVGVASASVAATYPTNTYKPAPTTYTPPTYKPAAVMPTTVIAPTGCASDYECGMNKQCVKAPLQSRGQCMTPVNSFGISNPANSLPRTNSVLPNLKTQGQCQFTTDCPIGFQCDTNLKVCVK